MLKLPDFQKALKIKGPGIVELTDSAAILQPKEDEVLVRVLCVAINPVDGKSTDLSPNPGATVGCDFSGKVVKIGNAVKQTFSLGDAVCGCVFGNNPDELDNGAFAEYVTAPGDLLFKIPSSMSFHTAATLGVGLVTVGMALYHNLKLPLPGSQPDKSEYVLVYGGGTATGTLAIQMLRLSGLRVITTCSPRNFERVKALGVVEAFDYHSPSCGKDIREYTCDSLKYAMDCITETESMKICYTAIGTKGGQYVALDPFPVRVHTRRSIKPNWIIAFTIFDKPINWQRPFQRDPRPKDREFGEAWFLLAQKLLDEGALEPHLHNCRAGGLGGISGGIDEVRKGLVAGSKLVFEVASVVENNL